MGKASDVWRVPDAHRNTAAGLAVMLETHSDVMWALERLEQMGPSATDAVEAVRDVPEIKRLSLSWQLWQALADGDGVDHEVLLAETAIDMDLIEAARVGLFGRPLAQVVCLRGES